jgi:alkylation response protein AidB-like acyl-CoA dehydrogenase
LRALAESLTTRHFAPLAAELDRDQRYPLESVKTLVDNGLTGCLIPTAFGGLNASLEAACAVAEEIARGCASTCTIWMAYVIGALPLLLAGTSEQQNRFLPEVVRGHAISFALTERQTGSDAAKVQTSAVQESGGWRLRGEKWLVGNGGRSQYYIIFAKVDGSDRISAFIADMEQGGLVVDEYLDKMGIRGATTSNLKIDCWVPADNQLGELGRGLSLALKCLTTSRIMAAAQACGIAEAAFREAAVYANQREAFGQPIIDFQGISFRLVDVATELSAARLLTYHAAQAHDEGNPSRELASMAKLYASEMSHRAVDAAVQVFGAAGYGKPHPAERHYRDQRVIEIYEGSSEIQRVTLTRAIKSIYGV